MLLDTLDRPLRDLRISVTDRCNFRCVYCMPKEVFGGDFQFLDRKELLTFEEISRLAHVFVAQGVQKIRITGGEPLVRRDLERLIGMLSPIAGVDLTLTTNGSLLAKKARALKDAGLQRVTVSLDSLDDAVFKAMNDVDFPVAKVLEGIETAAAVGPAGAQQARGLHLAYTRPIGPVESRSEDVPAAPSSASRLVSWWGPPSCTRDASPRWPLGRARPWSRLCRFT